jgi:excisionase family DNA binding protein
MSTAQLDRLLTRRETAAILRLHKDMVWKLCRDGKLPCIRIGRALKFHPADIVRFLEQRTIPASKSPSAHVQWRRSATWRTTPKSGI